ncbi:hypothetical protein BH20BAC1_BH20BAC1_18260 [soil metagenome]
MMNDCCGGMAVMMWIFMLLGIVALVALIMWIVKQSKKYKQDYGKYKER